ncbi:Serine/threonine-protein kinase TOR [Mycena sanguinolenta]|uniref:Serine/threonine-protein kinase TOR n=1 Tax=Mycena sanguinolenta TaxID=230812 RepID=A0A8H6XYK5_9AGAR|nr:Serine/threonine-protein kinase TOR [Mycena sanguinolenta]
MASTTPSDVLSSIFAGLKNNADIRLQSAVEVRRYVARTGNGADRSGARDGNSISRRLFEVVDSQDSTDDVEGLAIDRLIRIRPAHRSLSAWAWGHHDSPGCGLAFLETFMRHLKTRLRENASADGGIAHLRPPTHSSPRWASSRPS